MKIFNSAKTRGNGINRMITHKPERFRVLKVIKQQEI